jgi:hypothetical protein
MNIYFSLYLLVLILTLTLLQSRQKNISHLKSGWFFSTLTFAYYGFPIICMTYWPLQSHLELKRHIPNSFIIDISTILLICQIGFLIGELLSPSDRIFKKNRRPTYIVKSKYIFGLLILTYTSFFLKWIDVGGFSTIVTQSRFEYMNDVSENTGILNRYDILFYVVTAILTYNVTHSVRYIHLNRALIGFYSLFLLLSIMMGTRLILLAAIIGFFSMLFLKNKKLISNHKAKVIVCIFTLVIAFSAFKSLREDLGAYFRTGSISENRADISLIPSELFTGILSHHSIEYGVKVNEYTFTQRLIPQKLKQWIGLDKTTPYSQQIALYSHYSSGRAVYTIPYVTDLYFSLNRDLIVLFFTNIIIYIFFSTIPIILKQRNPIYLALFYILIYYVLRAETPVWLGRYYLSFGAAFIIINVFKDELYYKKTNKK